MWQMFKYIKNLVFIPKCKCCGRISREDNLCEECRVKMLKSRIDRDKRLVDKKFEYADKVYCSYFYRYGARDAVIRAKFKNPASFLNSLLTDISIDIENILRENNIDMVTSVPAHKSKFYRQEFDLSQEMAKRIAKGFDLCYKESGVKKRKTEKQHNISREARKVNLMDAFAVTEDVKGKNILLIDDVVTTGTTISTYALELKFAGAKSVVAWVYTYNTGKGN